MSTDGFIRMELSTGEEPVDRLDAINNAIQVVGARIWPLDFSEASDEIRQLAAQETLATDELEHLKNHFLLSRERLLEVIADAGREPQVAGGGALETHVVSHNYDYPRLYVAAPDVDYSRFERFHVNDAPDGTGVDEILQILCGKCIETYLRKPDESVIKLTIDCPEAEQGWLMTYDGTHPHVTTLSSSTPGTKILVQVIGTPQWSIRYVD